MGNGLPEILGSGIFDTHERFNFRNRSTEVPTDLRTVKQYELEFFLEDGGVSFINGQRHEIKKGCILLASPGDRRQSIIHFKALFMHFNVTDTRLKEMISTLPRFFTDCDYKKFLKLFSVLCTSEPQFDEYSDVAASGRLIRLLCALRQDAANGVFRDKTEFDYPNIPKAVEYIRAHYSEPLSADILARECNLSTSYFYRIFTQVTDCTPNDFIVKTRLTAAQSLLASTEMPIVLVAQKCGFNSQSYFSSTFKNRFGMSPKAFRQKHFYRL